jgi:integrase/recombinase XerD
VRGKGKKTRVIRLEAWAAAAVLRQVRAINAGVGRPRTTGPLMTVKREALAYWVDVGVNHVGRPEITPHDLRRTNATLLRNAGAELEQVQEHLGHANPETTRTCYDTEQRPLRVTTGLEIAS